MAEKIITSLPDEHVARMSEPRKCGMCGRECGDLWDYSSHVVLNPLSSRLSINMSKIKEICQKCSHEIAVFIDQRQKENGL
ncbi:MAG: hypothetical protein GY853_13250 [PVC group bacterium]|nr:hypothetical protein [PVC group bacterium]